MMIFKFLIPFYYLFYSRLKSRVEKLSWVIIYLIPPYLSGLYFMFHPIYEYSLFFGFALLIFNSIYEIGYLMNDTQTIKGEAYPTLRQREEDYDFFEKRYYLLIFLKLLVTLFLLFMVYLLAFYLSFEIYIFRFMILLGLVSFVFYLHNIIRNKANIITFLILAVLKYTSPLVLLLPMENLLSLGIIMFFIFPLPRSIEYATKEAYQFRYLQRWVGNFDLFRLKYYTLITCIYLLLYMVSSHEIIFIGVLLSSYFFVYRVSIYILIYYHFYKRN